MKPIAILSNKTRAVQRPPLLVFRVDRALLARFGFQRTRSAQRDAPQPESHTGQKPVVPNKAASRRKGARPDLPNSAAAAQSPVGQSPKHAGQPPAAKLSLPASQQPGKQSPPAQAEPQPQGQKQPQTRPPQVRKYTTRSQPGRLAGSEKRFSGQSSAAREGAGGSHSSEPETASNLKNPTLPQKPLGQHPGQPPADPNPGNGKSIGWNGSPANGRAPHLPNADPLKDAPKIPGTNGGNGANGKNGLNGAAPRSSLFRPGVFTTLPVVRVPPKASGPAAKPPTQIPMEVYNRQEEKDGPPPENGKPVSPLPALPSQVPFEPVVRAPSLEQLLKQNPDLPEQSAVLGVCEDGLPVLLDLNDPAPGALIVIGDEREAHLEMLRTTVSSIAGRTSPRNVQFIIFSCEPGDWTAWAKEKGFARYCLAVESADAESVRDWIVRLADWTEQRRLGQASGPSVLLVMDTLNFLPSVSYDIRLNFEWMAKEGPQARIWPLAVISTDLAKALSGRRMLRAFQTRVMGYASQPEDYVPLAGLDPQAAKAFGRRGEFAVKTGETWLRFRLLEK